MPSVKVNFHFLVDVSTFQIREGMYLLRGTQAFKKKSVSFKGNA
jgi:hypothetical protein